MVAPIEPMSEDDRYWSTYRENWHLSRKRWAAILALPFASVILLVLFFALVVN